MLVEPISCTSSEQPQAQNETEAGEKSLPQEPPLKRHKSDTLVTKTANVQHALGTCEEVLKYDKRRQNVAKNPKSRYHVERYETHLPKVQVLTPKAYKQVFNDIQNWKENFKLSRHREATEDELRRSIASQRKQMRTAS